LGWWGLVDGVGFSVRVEAVSCEGVVVVVPHSGRLGGSVIPDCAAAVTFEEVSVPGRQALVAFVEEAAVVAERLRVSANVSNKS